MAQVSKVFNPDGTDPRADIDSHAHNTTHAQAGNQSRPTRARSSSFIMLLLLQGLALGCCLVAAATVASAFAFVAPVAAPAPRIRSRSARGGTVLMAQRHYEKMSSRGEFLLKSALAVRFLLRIGGSDWGVEQRGGRVLLLSPDTEERSSSSSSAS